MRHQTCPVGYASLAGEFEQSLRRLGVGLTWLVQSTPQIDIVISVVEGDEPSRMLGKLAASQHPFDRWHVQRIADLSGLDLSVPPPHPNEQLWSWKDASVPSGV